MPPPTTSPPHLAGVSLSNKKAPLVLLVLMVVVLSGRATTLPPATPKAKPKAASGPIAYSVTAATQSSTMPLRII